MSAVADTRFLLTFRFPPTPTVSREISSLLQTELSHGMIIPSIVLTEYLKAAGGRIGFEAALTDLNDLHTRGAEIVDIDREVAVEAGQLLLSFPRIPVADALIGATSNIRRAGYILTDDPHFRLMKMKTRWV